MNNERVIPQGAHYTLYRISHLSSSDSGSDVKTTCKQERSKVSKWTSDSQTVRQSDNEIADGWRDRWMDRQVDI